jgi:hypothetical protein
MQGVARKRWGKGESNAAALVVVLAIGKSYTTFSENAIACF